ncbi:hypothetical protein DSCA_17180 [Desulfosarcina alkanivorans]|uniref:Uncharacterized protein n=1 Tax=Desulfosarcina alkanivorans TaxID=571177 RepID=A0A5K7YFF6_9BACT|nr:hypothetical protein DSCA_17180 [Desulfosarcina alkanivorans]
MVVPDPVAPLLLNKTPKNNMVSLSGIYLKKMKNYFRTPMVRIESGWIHRAGQAFRPEPGAASWPVQPGPPGIRQIGRQ